MILIPDISWKGRGLSKFILNNFWKNTVCTAFSASQNIYLDSSNYEVLYIAILK